VVPVKGRDLVGNNQSCAPSSPDVLRSRSLVGGLTRIKVIFNGGKTVLAAKLVESLSLAFGKPPASEEARLNKNKTPTTFYRSTCIVVVVVTTHKT
jgi:hypothetical protein